MWEICLVLIEALEDKRLTGQSFLFEHSKEVFCRFLGRRLWTQVGIRIGQFGQKELWDLSSMTTWRTKEPSYLSPALHRKGLDPALMRQAVRPTGSRGSRAASIREGTPLGRPSTVWRDSFIEEQNEVFADPLPPAVEVDPKMYVFDEDCNIVFL